MTTRDRRRLATSELVLGVAWSAAVTTPATEAEIADKYALSPPEMEAIKEVIGARLERWAVRLGYEDHPDEPVRPLRVRGQSPPDRRATSRTGGNDD